MATFAEASSVYQCASDVSVRLLEAENTSVLAFAASVSDFKRSLGDDSTDLYWKNYLRTLKRCRFDMLAAAVAPDYPFVGQTALVARLREQLRSCDELYPTHAGAAGRVLDALQSVGPLPESPVIMAARDMQTSSPGGETAVVLANSRFVAPSHAFLDAVLEDEQVPTAIHYSELAELKTWERLYFVGRAWWFPRWVFTSPRSRDLVITCYAGLDPLRLRDDEARFSRFNRSNALVPLRAFSRAVQDKEPTVAHPALDLDDLEPVVDWGGLSAAVRERRFTGSQEEEVDAFPVALEHEWFVFVEDEDGASVHAIDLTAEENEERVRQVDVRDLEPGMFILLRTQGSGDFVVTIADRLLGPLAPSHRAKQAEWKGRLRHAVDTKGLTVVARELEERGCGIANPVNVHRWTSPSARVIKTNKREDFEKILRYVGLGDAADEYWKALRKVTSAHLRAGRLIRQRLLEQVEQADLSALRRAGRATFHLKEADGGALEAFRIVDVSRHSEPVPHTLLRHPFKVETDDAGRAASQLRLDIFEIRP